MHLVINLMEKQNPVFLHIINKINSSVHTADSLIP